jgi:hypothetical protein
MNLSQTPPGGWNFHEPSTGWWMPNPIAQTHDQAVNLIIKHRLANPAIIAKNKLATDLPSVSRELIKYQQARGALAPDVLPKLTPPHSSPQMSGAVREVVAAVRKMGAGSALIMEWGEAGMPHVDQEVAESRASVCVQCPKNERGKSLTEIFTEPVAARIKEKMERQAQMNLKTTHDANLAVCQACLCPMKTKVWFPLDLIWKRLKPDQQKELNQSNPKCWIVQEIETNLSEEFVSGKYLPRP